MTNELKTLAAHYLPALEAEIVRALSPATAEIVTVVPNATGRERFYHMIH